MKCSFCEMISGYQGGKPIYEDYLLKVFVDKSKGNKGNLLIIPKMHCSNSTDITRTLLMDLMRVSGMFEQMLAKVYPGSGFQVLQKDGDGDSQGHYHFKVVALDGYMFTGADYGQYDYMEEDLMRVLQSKKMENAYVS